MLAVAECVFVKCNVCAAVQTSTHINDSFSWCFVKETEN